MIPGSSLPPCGFPGGWLSRKENCRLGIRLPRGAGVFDTSDLNLNPVSDVEDRLKTSALTYRTPQIREWTGITIPKCLCTEDVCAASSSTLQTEYSLCRPFIMQSLVVYCAGSAAATSRRKMCQTARLPIRRCGRFPAPNRHTHGSHVCIMHKQ